MNFNRRNYSNNELIDLYKNLLKPRLIEEKMLKLLRQGRVSKWFSGIGQEAIAVGATLALENDEYILPLHRNLGVFTSRNMALGQLMAQWQGKDEGFSKGRERSFHFGSNEHHIVGMISHLGPQLTIANGIALAHKLKGEAKCALAFTGDGGTSEGDFHEALNVAAVWDLPVIFLIENNGYGLSTPSEEQFKCKQFIDKGIGYGMEAFKIDGNNILNVYHSVQTIATSIRKKPRPILLECVTFRMRGHEEASGVKYVPTELIEMWAKRDPIGNYEQYLLAESIVTLDFIETLKKEIKAEIDEAVKYAFNLPDVRPNTQRELNDVYADYEQKVVQPAGPLTKKRLIDAISDGLRESMRKHSNLVLMGQDIAEYGGVFKITQGFVEEFGTERVRNTPLCESAIVGAALGLNIKGFKAMVEMQFADFVTCGFNQIVNNLAKINYRWGQNADVVVRMPTGAGVGAGPFHSQSNEAWFFHVPGIKIAYPSNPVQAKGALIAAFEDPNPVMFFEHKFLYRSIEQEVYDGYYTLPIGKGEITQAGNDLTIITYGLGVHWAKKLSSEMPHIDIEIIDLIWLQPFDKSLIFDSVRKTGKVLIMHEDTLTGGIGGEIAALIAEHCFQQLDAPVMRAASLDTPIPFAAALEDNFFQLAALKEKLTQLFEY